MRKTAIMLVGVALFDLGVMIVPTQVDAAGLTFGREKLKGTSKTLGDFKYLKIDTTYTEKACVTEQGKVVVEDGKKLCVWPATSSK